MSTFRYRFVGAPQSSLNNLIEPGAAATNLLQGRSPWTTVTVVDDTRQPDLDDLMQSAGYVPDATGPVLVVNGNHVMGSEAVIFADASLGPLQIDLPQASSRFGDELVFYKIDGSANAVTLVPFGGESVSGGGSLVLQQANESVRFSSDPSSADWRLISSRRAVDSVFDPGTTGLTSVNVQAAIEETLATASGILLVAPSGVTQFQTINAALAAAVSGSAVVLGPGTYFESFTVPSEVVVIGAYLGTTIIAGSSPIGTKITLSNNSVLRQCVVLLPTDSSPAILFAGGALDRANIHDIGLIGQHPLGIGIRNTSLGTLLAGRIEYRAGPCANVVEVLDGRLLLNQTLMSGGSATTYLNVSGGLLVAESIGAALPAVVTDVLTVGAAEVIATNVNSQVGTNGLHITSNSANVSLRSPRFNSDQYDLLVDPAVTQGTCHLLGAELHESKISTGGAWAQDALHCFTFQDDSDSTATPSGYAIWGDLRIGQAERGAECSLGRGSGFTRGMVVLTTDATANAVSDGGSFIDVTAAATSKTGSTFTFQGTGVGNSLLVATTLTDATGPLRLYGWRSYQTTAGVGGAFVFEIWNGAAWVGVNVHATSVLEFYSYANQVFRRANSDEHLRLGISRSTTWVAKSINGTTAYWMRVRISSIVTTLPAFERFELSPSRSEFNADGKESFFGLGLYRSTLFAAGNVYGETGSVIDAILTVGSGGLPTGWSHTVKNSFLNSNGDAIQFQFVLPRGICSAYPLRFVLYYTSTANTTVAASLSILPKAASGVLVADPTGAIPPISRTDANTPTLTATPGTAQSFNLPLTSVNKIHQVVRDGFDISSLYQGDMILLRFAMDDDGAGNADITVLAISISGVMWTLGEAL